MKEPRRGLTLLADKSYLYAFGGYTAEREFMNAVERYDPQRDVWERMNWAITPRTWAAAVNFENEFILIGGYNREGFLNLVERISPDTGRICYPPPLPTARAWLAAVVVQDRILTLGGEEPRGIGSTIESISPGCV
jgi:N-acetylneuraminic acid mutarotase